MDSKIRVAYLGRVSTLYNHSQDSSLIYQKEEIIPFILKQENEIFDIEKDCYEDRVSGTKIKKYNNNEQGFDTLMEKLGLEIEDINNSNYIEVSIKSYKNVKPYYQKIYCKSSSRINRGGAKGISLIEILKQLGVEVYFYDIRKSTKELSQEQLYIMGLMDNKYSLGQSQSTRNNFVYKTRNRELLLKGTRFGWDLVKKDNHRYYVINEDEYKIFKLIVKMMLQDDIGCDLISQRLEQLGLKTKEGKFLEKSHINRILKDRHYLGEEKYYDYPSDYVFQFQVERDYLKSLNFQWLKCDYIEPLIDEETFIQIQDKLQSRSNTIRGKRNPYLDITKKLVCYSCGANFYSLGEKNYFKERSFKCSSKRFNKNRIRKQCDSFIFYEPFLNEWIEKRTKTLKKNLVIIYEENLESLYYLKLHLALLIDKNLDSDFDELTTKQEKLSDDIERLLEEKLLSDTSNARIQNLIRKKDKELQEIENKIQVYISLKNQIKEFVFEIDKIRDKLITSRFELKDTYTREEYLSFLSCIYVVPKPSEKRHRNRVTFISKLSIEEEIFKMFSKLLDSDIISFLDEKTITTSTTLNHQRYIVRPFLERDKDKEARALEILDKMGLN